MWSRKELKKWSSHWLDNLSDCLICTSDFFFSFFFHDSSRSSKTPKYLHLWVCGWWHELPVAQVLVHDRREFKPTRMIFKRDYSKETYLRQNQHNLWQAWRVPATFTPIFTGKAMKFLPESKHTFRANDARHNAEIRRFTITAESSRAHWLIFIVNKRTDTWNL